MTASTPVDPKSAPFRRLRFESLDDAVREGERLAAAEKAGTLRQNGNWTLGQTLGHLATWSNFAFDGYPAEIKPPWFVKVLVGMKKGSFLAGSMPRGVRIPRLAEGTLGTEVIASEEGLRRFRGAMERLKSGAPPRPNPLFGALTHEQWIALNLRHAELHLGYLDAA